MRDSRWLLIAIVLTCWGVLMAVLLRPASPDLPQDPPLAKQLSDPSPAARETPRHIDNNPPKEDPSEKRIPNAEKTSEACDRTLQNDAPDCRPSASFDGYPATRSALATDLVGAAEPQQLFADKQKTSGHPTIVYTYEVKRTRCFSGFLVIRHNGPWDNPAGLVYKTVLDWRDVPPAELRALERFEFNSAFRDRSHAVQIP